jgi:hypothetical protein
MNQKLPPELRQHLTDAWGGLQYRFTACAEHDDAFTLSVEIMGGSPPPLYRYRQERDLFEFFETGFSVLETMCFGIHAIGSILDSTNFPMTTEEDLRKINVKKTAKRFMKHYSAEPLSASLTALREAKEYEEWCKVRAILTHQRHPGRTHNLVVGQSVRADWHQFPINNQTTRTRRQWLAGIVKKCLEDTRAFVNSHLIG